MGKDDGIKRLGPNRWQVRAHVVDNRTGHRVNRKQTLTGTLKDARRVRDELLADARSTSDKPARIRLSQFAASWLEQRANRLKGSVIKKYGEGLAHILPVLGEVYTDAIRPDDIRAYIADRLKVAAPNTVLNELRLIRVMAKDALSDRLCDRYWCERVVAPSPVGYTEERPNMLTGPQLAAVLNAIPKQWAALVTLMATTGLRWGEASGLQWGDLDPEVGVIRIRRGNWRGTVVTPKTKGSTRTVALLPELAAMLGDREVKGGHWLFPNRDGSLHKSNPLRKVLARALTKANLGHRDKSGAWVGLWVTTHGLRRTFNNLARQHTSAQVLRSITGHSTEAMTEHYSIVGASEKADVQRVVARAAGLLPEPKE
jgi:integrase